MKGSLETTLKSSTHSWTCLLTPPAASTYSSNAFRAIFLQGLKGQPLTRVRFPAVGASCHTLKGPLPLSKGPCCRRCPKSPAPSVWGPGSGLEQGQGDESGSRAASLGTSPLFLGPQPHNTELTKEGGPCSPLEKPWGPGLGPGSRTEGAQKPWRPARILHSPVCSTSYS